MEEDLQTIFNQTQKVITELLDSYPQQKGSIFVIGCSSSEIKGSAMGKNSSQEIGLTVFNAAYSICKQKELFLACQCCEHLNRALVIESECAKKYFLEEVSVVPWLHGGGSFATAAYNNFNAPVVVEHIKASCGIDIGQVLIGMHLKDVAVPLHLKTNKIGCACVTAAYCRPKLIGGERAKYK